MQLGHAVRQEPTTLSFNLSVNMYLCNVKSHTECQKDKKGVKKEVTGLVSIPVSKTLVSLVVRWPRDLRRNLLISSCQ